MSMGDRFINPLGFQVVRYRRDAETLAPVTISAPTADTTPGPSAPPISKAPTSGVAPRP
jgi:type IV secretion system protein VirB8